MRYCKIQSDMKTKPLIIIPILIAIFCAGYIFGNFNGSKPVTTKIVNEADAIETIKNKFPELKEYPSDGLPPRSVKTEKTDEGWYVAFIQEGSGRPIIDARCFLIQNDANITELKYIPKDDNLVDGFSAKKCTVVDNVIGGGSPCGLETCHGLDVICGPNPAMVCTMMYGIGDKCLQYAKCGVQNGICEQIQNPQFTQCKSCVQKCLETSNDYNVELFDCESRCK